MANAPPQCPHLFSGTCSPVFFISFLLVTSRRAAARRLLHALQEEHARGLIQSQNIAADFRLSIPHAVCTYAELRVSCNASRSSSGQYGRCSANQIQVSPRFRIPQIILTRLLLASDLTLLIQGTVCDFCGRPLVHWPLTDPPRKLRVVVL